MTRPPDLATHPQPTPVAIVELYFVYQLHRRKPNFFPSINKAIDPTNFSQLAQWFGCLCLWYATSFFLGLKERLVTNQLPGHHDTRASWWGYTDSLFHILMQISLNLAQVWDKVW